MAKYIPFPIDLSKYKEVRELTCAQFGILRRIIDDYWETGTELGKNDYTTYHAIRCPYKLWAMSKETVFKALNIAMPDVIEVRKRLVANKLALSKNARIAMKAIQERRRNKEASFTEENSGDKTNFVTLPKTHEETAWNKGQFDPVMRKLALKNNEENKEKTKLFFDK